MHFKKNAAGQVERIPDPTVKTNLPSNLLAAIGNTHVNLQLQVIRVKELLDMLGWPDRDGDELYDLHGPPLSSALDFARENARLTWVLCGLVNALEQSLGDMTWGDDELGRPVLVSMGDTIERQGPAYSPEEIPLTSPGSRATFYKVERPRAKPHPGAPRPVAPEDL